jgi:hypothetical protein
MLTTFNMNTDQDFITTTTEDTTLNFSNITVGQSGAIIVNNTTPYTISIDAADMEVPDNFASILSGSGKWAFGYHVPNGASKAVCGEPVAVS